ncbi:hypothetical protein GGI15_004351 [Coemansia interrupta]|uniref:DUF2423 domain-containing protein n=1 Tax=Coemansia interrupta TaxID=1126814 RepID=A0A9W8H7N7_9FUNG|nr:hypothetical protein GGI15_004351 [Coemansia interrupta]
MAKSARSKSKIRNRNALRETVFGPHEQARIQRLAEKQKAAAEADAKVMANDVTMNENTTAGTSSSKDAAGDVDMVDSDSEKPQKVSRSKKRSGKIAKNQRIVKVRCSNGQFKKKRILRWTKSTGFN